MIFSGKYRYFRLPWVIRPMDTQKVKVQFSSWPQITRWSVHKYIHNVTKVMCALYVRCALSVLQKECRKVLGARYTLGARYRSENTVYIYIYMYWTTVSSPHVFVAYLHDVHLYGLVVRWHSSVLETVWPPSLEWVGREDDAVCQYYQSHRPFPLDGTKHRTPVTTAM